MELKTEIESLIIWKRKLLNFLQSFHDPNHKVQFPSMLLEILKNMNLRSEHLTPRTNNLNHNSGQLSWIMSLNLNQKKEKSKRKIEKLLLFNKNSKSEIPELLELEIATSHLQAKQALDKIA